jgi:CheY-like chemotaxis protein
MCLEKNPHLADLADSAILLVEDNEEDILLLRRAFRNANIANRLVEVRDGQAAIQYLSGDADYADRARYPIPFLVLLDLRLPKLSGFEVLAWIRDQPEFAELIIVVLTGSDQVQDITKAHELGANSYLVKPGDFHDLVEIVKRIEGRWLITDRPHEPASWKGASRAR